MTATNCCSIVTADDAGAVVGAAASRLAVELVREAPPQPTSPTATMRINTAHPRHRSEQYETDIGYLTARSHHAHPPASALSTVRDPYSPRIWPPVLAATLRAWTPSPRLPSRVRLSRPGTRADDAPAGLSGWWSAARRSWRCSPSRRSPPEVFYTSSARARPGRRCGVRRLPCSRPS